MKSLFIKEALEEMDFPVESMSLGDFDFVGEFTAKKNRDQSSDLYKKVGCFFRPNYERGLLIYALITKFQISSFLEIGFGRGYSAFCAAMAMSNAGIDGKIVTIDPNFDEKHLENLTSVFPKGWFDKISFMKGTSDQVVPELKDNFEMIYIDGDHREEAVKKDWDMTKEKYTKFLLFDDYHLPTKNQKDIECAKVIDEIDDKSKKLIRMDRRVFFDDRRVPDSEIDYGQVLLTHPDLNLSDYILDW